MAQEASSAAAGWEVDPNHTQVGFSVRHLGITRVNGQFHDFEVDLQFNPDDLATSSASATIQAASIDTGIQKRDDHLRSPDFFDVEQFPTLTFVSTGVQDIEEDEFELTGDLTIHGVTKPVVLEVEKSPIVKDPSGTSRIAFSATTEIDREEFGLNWNQALEAGGFLVGKQVRISIEAEALKPPAEAAQAGR